MQLDIVGLVAEAGTAVAAVGGRGSSVVIQMIWCMGFSSVTSTGRCVALRMPTWNLRSASRASGVLAASAAAATVSKFSRSEMRSSSLRASAAIPASATSIAARASTASCTVTSERSSRRQAASEYAASDTLGHDGADSLADVDQTPDRQRSHRVSHHRSAHAELSTQL